MKEAAIGFLVLVLIMLVIWAFWTVLGIMQDRLELSLWEAAAILIVTATVFVPGRADR